jgi:threonine aldolase
VQSNAVFARLPRHAIAPLLERFQFYVWDERGDEVRWICSWDTSDDDVAALAQSVAAVLGD